MSKLKKFLVFPGDVIILYGSLALTLLIRYLGEDFKDKFSVHVGPFTVIFVFWILVLYLFNFYRYKMGARSNLFRDVFLATLTASLVSTTSFYLFPQYFELTPKTNLAIFGVVFLLLKYGWQWLVMKKIFPSGRELIAVLGDSELIRKTVNHMEENPQIGYKVEEWIKNLDGVDIDNLPKKINQKGIHTIVIENGLAKKARVTDLVYKCLTYGINVVNFWAFYEEVFEKVPLTEIEESWFIENITVHRPIYDRAKRVADVVFAIVALILFSPFFIIAAILTAFSSKGPVIYTDKRTGKDNKTFTLYKFRTMRHNHNGPSWTKENDKRVTPVGKFLRKTHLDELPQLVNILKGNISVIGPRPERVELVKKFEEFPYYDMRHIINPGLTGWAQINYRPSASLEEAREKLTYDIYYVKNRSPFLDFSIILKTIRHFFTSSR